MAAPFVERLRRAWTDAGRDGEPYLLGLTYYSLGDDATDASIAYLRDYYGFLGDFSEHIAQGTPRSERAVRDVAAAFQDLGFDELVFDPTVAKLEQVDRLADVLI